MSTEENVRGSGLGSAATSHAKRVPVATADGAQASKTADATGSASGRRKRVRISTSERDAARPASYTDKRFGQYRRPMGGDDHSHLKGEYPDSPQRQQRQHDDIDPYNRVDYDQRYQEKRKEGSYNYTYSHSTNPNAANAGKPKKKLKKKKKAYKPIEPVKYQEVIDPNQEIRLNKFLSNAGVASRREADVLIQKGEILVNGVAVTELGTRITSKDEVTYNGKPVQRESKVYVLLNKPKNCVTTSDDPEGRLTVMDIVRHAATERIYPVGRLDRHTTGVLLITNDGELASKLTHPSFLKKKVYHVWLDKVIEIEHMQQIAEGIELEDGEIHADAISYVREDDHSQVGIEIHSGRNRIVRRIFEHFGYKVIKLDRVYFAGLTKKNLPRGRWRYLNEDEVNALRMGAFE